MSRDQSFLGHYVSASSCVHGSVNFVHIFPTFKLITQKCWRGNGRKICSHGYDSGPVFSCPSRTPSALDEAIEAAKSAGCKDLAILHCVSGYPAPAEDYNLKTITEMKKKFNLVTGLSDHTLDNNTAIASVALGASIIEKHFTLNRDGGGPDDSFSLEPMELKNLCNGTNIAWSALGDINFSRKSSEKTNAQFK